MQIFVVRYVSSVATPTIYYYVLIIRFVQTQFHFLLCRAHTVFVFQSFYFYSVFPVTEIKYFDVEYRPCGTRLNGYHVVYTVCIMEWNAFRIRLTFECCQHIKYGKIDKLSEAILFFISHCLSTLHATYAIFHTFYSSYIHT